MKTFTKTRAPSGPVAMLINGRERVAIKEAMKAAGKEENGKLQVPASGEDANDSGTRRTGHYVCPCISTEYIIT